jgi:hypothetical protein
VIPSESDIRPGKINYTSSRGVAMTDEELITYLELTLTYPVRVFPDGLEIRDCGTYRTKMDPSFPSVETGHHRDDPGKRWRRTTGDFRPGH